MKTILYVISTVLIFYACGGGNKPKKEDPDTTNAQETSVKPNDENKKDLEPKEVSPPEVKNSRVKDSIPVHVFKSGETLWNLGRKHYGNRHYSSTIAIYNNIKNVNAIENGTKIKIPPLKMLLQDATLQLSPIAAQLDSILQARTLFMKHEKMLADKRETVEGRMPIQLSTDEKEDLQKAVVLIKEAMRSLRAIDTDSIKAPIKTIGQLKSVASNLSNLSKGNHDGPYGYDLDMVHQRLIHAINNSIHWAENNYQ